MDALGHKNLDWRIVFTIILGSHAKMLGEGPGEAFVRVEYEIERHVNYFSILIPQLNSRPG